jgi:hypothetical protein
MLRSFFLFLFVVWMMALGTVASCTGARADELHPLYRGKWCHQPGDEESKASPSLKCESCQIDVSPLRQPRLSD